VSKSQHVYFIGDKRRRYVKIGVSNDPWWRIQDLQAGSPLELRLDLVLDFDTDRSRALVYEDALHQHFAEYWRFREWFDYATPIRVFVDGWKSGDAPDIPAPAYSSKQHIDSETGACLSKEAFMTLLRDKARRR